MTHLDTKTGRQMPRRLLFFLTTLILLAGLARAADKKEDAASTSELEWQLLEAETALMQGESQIAESHYRAALKESWYLLALASAAEDDLPAAREILDRARNAAAMDLERVRVALALVALHLGEVEEPLKELRFVALENPRDVELRRTLIQSLRAAGREEEWPAELEKLREMDPAATNTLSDSSLSRFPALELGSLGSASAEDRVVLRSRLQATLLRIDRNLVALKEQTGFRRENAKLTGPAALSAHPSTRGEPFGRVDFKATDVKRAVLPFRLSPVALMATAPPSLRPAIIRLDADDPEGALSALRVRLGGEDGAEARALLGSLLAQEGRHVEAEEELTTATAADPKAVAPRQALARLYWLTDRREQAVEPLRQAAELGPLDRDLTWILAKLELAEGRLDAAWRQLRSLDKRFDSVAALLRMSELSHQLGEEKRALDEAERAARLAPSSEEVLLNHVRLALAAGVVSSATRTVEPLVRLHPDVAEYHDLLGQTWTLRRDTGEASEAFLKAVELDPDRVSAFLLLGLALNQENRFEEARDYLRRFLEAHPQDVDAMAGLAEAEERLGDHGSAETRIRLALAKDPLHARANLVLGMVHRERGELEEARESLRQAVTSDPWLAKAHYQLSLVCTRLRDQACAEEHFEHYKKALAGPESNLTVLEAEARPTLMKKQEGSSP